MEANNLPEVWMRGPVEGVPALLQPVAHALLQAQEETGVLLTGFPAVLLWKRPAGIASAGFHLQHMAGVLDRLFTYADNRMLSPAQLNYLAAEGKEDAALEPALLLQQLQQQISIFIDHLKNIDPATLTESRTVGRKRLPSTVLGLLFHAAEHTMRHTGQLLVTVSILKATAV